MANNQKLHSSYFIVSVSLITSLLTSYIYNISNDTDIKLYKQAKSYHTYDFYFDKNPPIANLIYTLIIKLFCIVFADKNTQIKENLIFYCSVNTYQILSSVMLSVSYLITYKTLRIFCSSTVSKSVVMLLIFENYLHFCTILQNNLNFLLFFTVSSVYFFLLYKTQHNVKYMYVTGLLVSLGLTANLGMLFIAVPIVCILIADLFNIACDKRRPILLGANSFACMLLHHLVCFILLPAVVYIGMFYVHISYQINYTNDASIMSLRYQGQLAENYLELSDKYIIDRSLVTLVNVENKVYIKSENEVYTKGSQQQVVFAEDYKDENSIWKLVKIHVDKEPKMTDEQRDFFVKNGDYIKLVHVTTNKYLHSHNIEAENSSDKKLKEVSGYGDFSEGITDDNDFWVINSNTEYVMTRLSTFTLTHVKTGNFLGVRSSTTLKTNDRHEVYSSSEGRKKFRSFIFEDNKIDSHHKNMVKDMRLNEKIQNYEALTFWQKFMEINSKMITKKNQTDYKLTKAYIWPFTKGKICFEHPITIENQQKIIKLRILKTAISYVFPHRLQLVLSKVLQYAYKSIKTNQDDKIAGFEGNEINWYIALLTFVFPILWILNESCKYRNVIHFCFKPQILYFFLIYTVSYFLQAVIGQDECVTGYFMPFVFSILIGGYLASLISEKLLHVVVALSLSTFCKNICQLIK